MKLFIQTIIPLTALSIRQEVSWKKYCQRFLFDVLKRFYSCHVFTFLTFFLKFFLERFYIYGSGGLFQREIFTFNGSERCTWSVDFQRLSRATAVPGETFSRGPKHFHRAPLGRKFLNFPLKNGTFWRALYFWSTAGPPNVAGPGVANPPYPTLSTGLVDWSQEIPATQTDGWMDR